jgi:hypothetical protein
LVEQVFKDSDRFLRKCKTMRKDRKTERNRRKTRKMKKRRRVGAGT